MKKILTTLLLLLSISITCLAQNEQEKDKEQTYLAALSDASFLHQTYHQGSVVMIANLRIVITEQMLAQLDKELLKPYMPNPIFPNIDHIEVVSEEAFFYNALFLDAYERYLAK